MRPVAGALLIGAPRTVERVAEQNEAAGWLQRREHARDAAAEGMAADDRARIIGYLRAIGIERALGRAPRQLNSRGAHPASQQAVDVGLHARGVARRPVCEID